MNHLERAIGLLAQESHIQAAKVWREVEGWRIDSEVLRGAASRAQYPENYGDDDQVAAYLERKEAQHRVPGAKETRETIDRFRKQVSADDPGPKVNPDLLRVVHEYCLNGINVARTCDALVRDLERKGLVPEVPPGEEK